MSTVTLSYMKKHYLTQICSQTWKIQDIVISTYCYSDLKPSVYVYQHIALYPHT